MDALSKVKQIKHIPVVYIMVLNPCAILFGERNIAGISMNISQRKQLVILSKVLPDITVITPETIEFLLLFSLENRIPVFTFSEKYVESGALMSIIIDAFDIGCQAGEMAKAIQAEKDIDHTHPVAQERCVYRLIQI